MNIKYGKHDLGFCNSLFTIYVPKRHLKIVYQYNQLIINDKLLKTVYNLDAVLEKIPDRLLTKSG
jgi:hypothetical protein